MEFKVGDIVKVKEDLKVNEFYDNFLFSYEHEKFKGKQFKIEKIAYASPFTYIYFKLEGIEILNFSPTMLELVKDDSINNLNKALELLNMTEEEMLKEYDKKNKDKLIDNMIKEFDEFCDKYNMSECKSKCKYKGNTGICSMLFAMEYLQEKGLLKENINENN